MRRKDFSEFLNKSSRIIERALDNNFDVIGDFFKEDDEEQNARTNKREKMTHAFVF